jgi:hypothetical protein
VETALQNNGDYAAWTVKRRLIISYRNYDQGVGHLVVSVNAHNSGTGYELSLLFRTDHNVAPIIIGPFQQLDDLVQTLKDCGVPLHTHISVPLDAINGDSSTELMTTGDPTHEEAGFETAAPIDVSMQGYELAFETSRWGPMKSLAQLPLFSRNLARTDRMWRHVVFIVEFTQVGRRGCCSSTRVLRKRFRQFKGLHNALQAKVDSPLPALPHTRMKRVVSNSSYICRKMQSLESYLQVLLIDCTINRLYY